MAMRESKEALKKRIARRGVQYDPRAGKLAEAEFPVAAEMAAERRAKVMAARKKKNGKS